MISLKIVSLNEIFDSLRNGAHRLLKLLWCRGSLKTFLLAKKMEFDLRNIDVESLTKDDLEVLIDLGHQASKILVNRLKEMVPENIEEEPSDETSCEVDEETAPIFIPSQEDEIEKIEAKPEKIEAKPEEKPKERKAEFYGKKPKNRTLADFLPTTLKGNKPKKAPQLKNFDKTCVVLQGFKVGEDEKTVRNLIFGTLSTILKKNRFNVAEKVFLVMKDDQYTGTAFVYCKSEQDAAKFFAFCEEKLPKNAFGYRRKRE